MPLKIQNNKEPLERLKDLIGFKWSYVITFLIGLYLPVFGIGFFFGGVSTRSESRENSQEHISQGNNQDLSRKVVEYEKIIIANIKEKQQFKDSVEVLSKKVDVFYRIIKDYKNEREAKK